MDHNKSKSCHQQETRISLGKHYARWESIRTDLGLKQKEFVNYVLDTLQSLLGNSGKKNMTAQQKTGTLITQMASCTEAADPTPEFMNKVAPPLENMALPDDTVAPLSSSAIRIKQEEIYYNQETNSMKSPCDATESNSTSRWDTCKNIENHVLEPSEHDLYQPYPTQIDYIDKLTMLIVQKIDMYKGYVSSKHSGSNAAYVRCVNIGCVYNFWTELRRDLQVSDESLAKLFINTIHASVLATTHNEVKQKSTPDTVNYAATSAHNSSLKGKFPTNHDRFTKTGDSVCHIDSDTSTDDNSGHNKEINKCNTSMSTASRAFVNAGGGFPTASGDCPVIVHGLPSDGSDTLTAEEDENMAADAMYTAPTTNMMPTLPVTSYKCLFCNKTYKNRRAHYNHMKTHCSSHEGRRKPSTVKKKSSVTKNQPAAKNNHPSINESMPSSGDTVTTVAENPSAGNSKFVASSSDIISDSDPGGSEETSHKDRSLPKSYTCRYCQNVSQSHGAHMTHMIQHKDQRKLKTCHLCGAQVVKLGAHIRLTHSKPEAAVQCPYCGKTYRHKNALRTHIQHGHTASAIEPVECEQCGVRVLRRRLKKHMLEKHSGRKSVCPQCGKQFHNPYNLRVHMRTHSGDKPYSCSHCSQRFTQKWYCVVHERSHTNDRPYICEVCGETFPHVTFLNTHRKTHSQESESDGRKVT